MALVIGFWLAGMVLFAIGVYLFFKCEDVSLDFLLGICLLLVGALLVGIVIFVGAPNEIPVGLPARNIVQGEYKVAFVYVAGENINLGIERNINPNNKESKERLYLYQFPKSAFESDINSQAKRLVVVGPNKFKRLVLK